MITPFLADGIDFPIVLGLGLVVLIPLLVFEVSVEAFVLKRIWLISFRDLCRFTLVANCLSLLAGIPVKVLNSMLYGILLPEDLPGFYSWYPFAVFVGTLIYFCATVAVEGAYAFRWLRRNGHAVSSLSIWKGVLVANLASYAVVAPLHYYLTRPYSPTSHEFVRNTQWTRHLSERMLFRDGANENLRCVRLDGSMVETVVPAVVRDYLVSADLKLCLFRDTNDDLCFFDHGKTKQAFAIQSKKRFLMNSAAFSPSGKYVAFASESGNSLTVLDMETGQQRTHNLDQKAEFHGPSVAWSTNELRFYVAGFENGGRLKFTIQPSGDFLVEPLQQTDPPDLLTCYARISNGAWYGGDDWGPVFSRDACGDLQAYTEPGLGSHLAIYRGTNWNSKLDFLAVNPGLLHLAQFYFSDVAILDGCNECLFDANGYIYLLDIQKKRVGTLVRGDRFILLTPRYKKTLEKKF